MELYLAIFAGLSGMLGWGLADFFAKKTVDKIGDIKTLFWAQIFGAIPILIILICSQEPINMSGFVFFLIFLFAIGDLSGYLLFYRGLQKGMVSILSPIFAAQSGVAVLVSSFIFGETISQSRWLGLAIAFVGIILISFQPQESDKFSAWKLIKGLPEVLAGMLIFGFFFPCWDWFLEYQGQGWIVPAAFQRIFLITIFLSAICIFTLLKRSPITLRPKENKIWVWLILIGLFDALAALVTTWGYKFTTITSVVVVLSGAFPLPTVILARIFLKEKLTKNQTIGIAAVIAGLIVLAI